MVNRLLNTMTMALFLCSTLLFASQTMAAQSIVNTTAQNSSTENNEPEIPLFKEYQGRVYVTAQPTNIVLGNRFTLTIKGEELNKSFTKIDWSEFKQHFVIYDVDIGFDRIKVRLYPIESGTFNLAGQKAGVITLPPLQIKVQSNPEVSIQWQAPDSKLFVHQNAVWKALVTLKNSANKATFEQRDPKVNQSVMTRLQELPVHSTEDLESATKGKTETLVASYEVLDFQASEQIVASTSTVLHSPIVVVKNTTNRRWYFFDRTKTVNLHPLPSFLPMTVAVGQIEWASKPLGNWQTTGDLHYWTWQLTGTGLTKAYLNSVAHQLLGQISHNPQIEWLSDSREIDTIFTTQGLQSTLKLRLPYRTIEAGLITFPELQLRYFNPKTGLLTTETHPDQTTLSVPNWLIWFVQWGLLLLSILVGLTILLSFKQAWINRRLIRQIRRSEDIETLWQAMFSWQHQQVIADKPYKQSLNGQLQPQSMGQWLVWYQQQFGESKQFEEVEPLVQAINQVLYAPATKAELNQSEWQNIQQKALLWANGLKWYQNPLSTLKHFKSEFKYK